MIKNCGAHEVITYVRMHLKLLSIQNVSTSPKVTQKLWNFGMTLTETIFAIILSWLSAQAN